MSFIATPPPQHTWAEPEPAHEIPNDGFFPSVDPADVRNTIRINGTVTEQRLVESVHDAIAAVNRELSAWRVAQIDQGCATLDAVPAAQVGGISVLIHHYRRAVYQLANADLIERYRDFDTTAAGEKRAQELDSAIEESRRNARWAVLDILGLPHLTVELI